MTSPIESFDYKLLSSCLNNNFIKFPGFCEDNSGNVLCEKEGAPKVRLVHQKSPEQLYSGKISPERTIKMDFIGRVR